MSQFKIDYSRLTLLLVPSFLRSSRILLLLRAAIQGVDSAYGKFTTNRSDNLFRLSNNSQVCYLEHVLNEKYDKTNRKIYIDDYSAYGTLSYIYTEIPEHQDDHMYVYSEKSPSLSSTPILCSEVALATGVTTFNVMIAQTSSDIQPVYDYVNGTINTSTKPAYRRFCALINTYKLAGKKYKVVPYTPKTAT
jgi:hypothetical protein